VLCEVTHSGNISAVVSELSEHLILKRIH